MVSQRKIYFFLFGSFVLCGLYAHDDLKVFAIAGQGDSGSQPAYVSALLGLPLESVYKVPTPGYFTNDFGQNISLVKLKKSLGGTPHDFIVHATSQGTATAINYFAQNNTGPQPKALILESALASGNSAICYTALHKHDVRRYAARMPFAHYWLPYLAKLSFPLYGPAGLQPIKSIEMLPRDIVVIIIHSEHDWWIPYKDACAIYYRLYERGNPVYLITQTGTKHTHILSKVVAPIVPSILQKHGILSGEPAIKDLSRYQPNPFFFTRAYEGLCALERGHEYISRGVLCAQLYAGYRATRYVVERRHKIN